MGVKYCLGLDFLFVLRTCSVVSSKFDSVRPCIHGLGDQTYEKYCPYLYYYLYLQMVTLQLLLL